MTEEYKLDVCDLIQEYCSTVWSDEHQAFVTEIDPNVVEELVRYLSEGDSE